MNSQQQIISLIKKNLLISYRNREVFIEVLLPIIVSIMLTFREYLSEMKQLMPLLYSLATASTQRSILIKLVEEKSKRYKELQKIMGMSEKSYLIGWVLTGYIRVIIAVIIFELSWYLMFPIFGISWEEQFNESFISLTWPYFLFSIASMNQIFLFSSLFNEVKIAGEIQSFFQIACVFFIYFTFVESAANSFPFYFFLSIFSPQCSIAFTYVASMKPGVPGDILSANLFPSLQIMDIYSPTFEGTQMAAQAVVYFLLFLYCEQVIPNEYGVAKEPLFFLKRNKVQIKENDLFAQLTTDDNDVSSAIYHEEIKYSSPPSIIIKNLQKRFGTLKAVDNISLYLYESEIFCLLGHNGAGKTTAISVLTGMISKTSGLVSMYGMNLDTQLPKIRQSLGLCTQKDCLYEDLTVEENLEYISSIKGRVDKQEILDILRKTDLIGERSLEVKVLSGGSKRKLSLGMSLVGNSKIIFLDEPTSGMDAYSRRQIWTILERIRQDQRTIILTTHHLDEAEVLANRIGIMSKGQLLAVGTSNFIKKKFGEGYNLKLTFNDVALKNQIYEKVNKYVPECFLETEHSNENQYVFNIPFTSKNSLGQLFQELEEMSVQIGLSMKTLEDAFVKIGMEEEQAQLSFRRKSEIQIAKQSLGIPATDDDTERDNQEFYSYPVEVKEEEVENDLKSIPKCLSNDPSYSFFSQIMAIFLRRYYTVVRTTTNYFSIIIPMIAFINGLVVVAYVKFQDEQYKELPDYVLDHFKINLLASCCVIAFCFNATIYITQPVLEKEYQLKQSLHGMGLRNSTYWLGTFLFDLIIFFLNLLLFLIVSALLDLNIVFDNIIRALSCFLLFGPSQILFAYIMGFVFNKLESALKLFTIFCFFILFCLPNITFAFAFFFYKEFDKPTFLENVLYVLEILFSVISPFYAFFSAYLFTANNYDDVEAFFEAPYLLTTTEQYLLIMLGQIAVFAGVLFFLENKKSLLIHNHTQQEIQDNVEEEVQNERDRVLKPNNNDPIKSKFLEKQYIKGKPTLQQLTFSVKKGEILGIIGPNGAGKSTLINIFSGINTPTAGQALLNDIEPKQQIMSVMQHVGVCPQFDCIWENLTPVEHLQLFGRIKGLQGKELQTAVAYFIKTMQLDLFIKTKAGQLSGGNKRKLCVADALIGGSDITFFDEPSTGVDPISRRFLFNTLKRNIQLRACSAIMTTHTIEEAESLSDRIGILIAGQFKCLGSPQDLRQKHGSGYQIQIKYINPQVTSSIQNQFPNAQQLDERREGYLMYSVPKEGFSFYKSFNFFQRQQQEGNIEDFQIEENSLEQVFIHFSKIQQEINEKEGIAFD
ncbi:unnamed protein product (macronuclear) [Paramecium tetraurelia]|uniref:ABC transporter domain-containing protein n=1 Tax=Paramecium tetraurelia TaxID=5888 RepID=A0CMM5_PARTE|nr:uncharacterized protein GSPATT00008521001 [Paramecium tetraurelia]CAK72042.1 unnamed protein product [Paramecium tetraurelia]|eukprot:XP_001439439.1 hypothetical protein (macronuclear) [Paramecium tetraurelia strain d4-2]